MRKLFLVLLLCCFSQPAWAKIVISNSSPVQGETIEVTYYGEDANKHEGSHSKIPFTFNGKSYSLFPDEEKESSDENGLPYLALIAIPADLSPGKYSLAVADEQCSIVVKDAKFPVQHLTLPKAKNNFNMSPGEEETVNAAKATLSAKRLWDGHFTKPCQARISAVFGIRRVVNGKLLKDYYHSGIDFAGNLGQPVTACADGIVVLAHRNFKLHGNVIALDHGQGVITIYIHLQKIMVKEGDLVKAGQQIGAVGATGRANGPHLHLSLYVNQIAANPLPWFTKTF